MATARNVLGKLKSSDGRIRVKTLSGVSALVAVIALLVGVLPVMAHHSSSLVQPGDPIPYGGGPGACSATIEGHLPSAAGNELHINNPTPSPEWQRFFGPDNTEIQLKITGPTDNRVFEFKVMTPGFVVYDVVVNGGPQNNHYDYDRAGLHNVTTDKDLHAPRKGNKLHNLSHINICYDVPGVTLFVCDEPVTLTEPTGLFRTAEATIFANSVLSCDGKRASFLIEDGGQAVTLAFTGDTGVKVAGRLDVTKEFPSTSFDDLTYDPEPPFDGPFQVVQWCETRPFATGDGEEFSDWLPTTGVDASYPALPVEETACKVAENEDLSGTQFTVVYFEFEDPQFR
jgi:hypothetical protein